MIDINSSESVIHYLEPGWPRAASSLTASCLALTLSTRLASSSLRPAVSSSMEGMAAVLRTAFSQETRNPCKLLAARPGLHLLHRDTWHLYGFPLPSQWSSWLQTYVSFIDSGLVLILSKIHEHSATVLPSLIFTRNIFEVSARCRNNTHALLFILLECLLL